MKKTLLLLLFSLVTLNLWAVEVKFNRDTTSSKAKFRLDFTGRIDAMAFTDSYKSIDSRGGIQYMMPARPSYDVNGADLNYEGQLRFGIASTRLGVKAAVEFNKKTSIEAVVEIDFMGVSNDIVQSLRMRHAYFRLNLGRSSLLFGQTSHLAMVEQIAPPTVTYASGYPINAQSRPIQIQFAHRIGQYGSVAVAASMFSGAESQMQSWAMTPDISARVIVGNPQKNAVGAVVGFKSITPHSPLVLNKDERLNSFYGALFGRVTMGKGYALRAYGIIGGDLTTLGFTGGYAVLSDHQGYAPLSTVSAWLDFQTPRYAGFEFGVFGGYQQNLGSSTSIDKQSLSIDSKMVGLQSFWRVAPRVWYHFKMLSFGFEYMYSEAIWAHTWDQRYTGTINFPASRNNRYTLLARFTF